MPKSKDDVKELRAALEQISAIRDSIVAHQNVNFSLHIYPLVAVLAQVGIEAEGSIEEMQARYCKEGYARHSSAYQKLGSILEDRGLRRENNPLLRGACVCRHNRIDHEYIYGDSHCLVQTCDCKHFERIDE